MTIGITTWDQISPIDGNVLLIVNSVEDRAAVDAVLDALTRAAAPSALHVIAGPGWGQALNDRGIPDERILQSVGAAGQQLELIYFLEGPTVSPWVAARQFRVIVGSEAHSLHNDEVKDLFEQRVSLLIGDGRFLAHTLPGEYLFLFDLVSLAERIDRVRKRDAYTSTCRALVDDLYCTWQTRNQPVPPSDSRLEDVPGLLQKHLGAEALAFDETAAAPIADAGLHESVAKLGMYFRAVLCQHDRQIADYERAFRQMHDDHVERVQQLTDSYQDRFAAVAERDQIIEELRRRLWLSRLRDVAARWLKPR